MKPPNSDDYNDGQHGDAAYLEAITAYAKQEGIKRPERCDDYAWALLVRCHIAGIKLGSYDARYACMICAGKLRVFDTQESGDGPEHMSAEVGTVHESYALTVLAALNMHDRAEKAR